MSEPAIPFRAQLCLSMIVKNEAHVIERCMASLRPFISAWAIVDTGSSDGTQARIRDLLADLPGELIERPWQDFATNRNQALELARRFGEYALIHDADDVLELAPDAALPERLGAPAYYLRRRLHATEFEYAACRLLRLDLPWRWHGVLHEYPALDPQPDIPHLPGLAVCSHADGQRSQQSNQTKFRADAAVLRKALGEEPDNARYVFYLAQSLRDAGDTDEALAVYRQRAAMGGWAEEVWYALFQEACLLERLQHPQGEVMDAYLRAWEARPSRAEPLCELARYLRLQGRPASAWLYARTAAELPRPIDRLFVDAGVYAWRARDEQAVAAWHVGRREQSVALCRNLLAGNDLPASERPRVEANLRYVLDTPAPADCASGPQN